MERQPDLPELPAVNTRESYAGILYTSGTTDQPKGVLYDYGNRFHANGALNHALGITPDDRILEYRSLGWASAQGFGLMTPLYNGATSFVAKRFSQSRFFEWIREYRITVAVGIPVVINMLLDRPVDAARVDLSSVRFMTSSTSALLPEQQRKFEAMYGIPIIQAYGMSEGGWLAANSPDNRKIGSVGRPCLYQDLRIVGPDGSDLAQGEIGEIETGGPSVSVGYLNYDGTVQSMRGRRLKTGDLGYLDEDHFLFITGRSKDLIIRGGVNISPLEIEDHILRHPYVIEACVLGVPDPVYGEEVVALVVPREGANLAPEAVLAHCATSLPDYKSPKEARVVASIPRNDRGKIDRASIAEMWKDADARLRA